MSDDLIVDLHAADPLIPADLRAFVEAGGRALDAARKAVQNKDILPDGAVVQAVETKLHAPWPGLRIAAIGGNYGRHKAGLTWQQPNVLDAANREIREAGVWGFFKVSLPVGGPDDEVPYPARTRYFDYEGEVAVVIGRRTKNFKGTRADDVIFGVTLMNDWSIRDDANPSRPFNFNLPKNFDGSTTLGPSIVVDELKYDDVPVTTRVNGTIRQEFNSNEMVHSFAECIEWLSKDLTLYPGDILSGGTSAGTANDQTPRPPEVTVRQRDLFLAPGDEVEVHSPAIGTLRNRVV